MNGASIPAAAEVVPPLSCWADARVERRAGWSLVADVDLRAADRRLASVALLPVVDKLRAFNSRISASLDSDEALSASGSVTTSWSCSCASLAGSLASASSMSRANKTEKTADQPRRPENEERSL